MSTVSTPAPPKPAPPRDSFLDRIWVRSKPGELVVFHHSTLFYWWPVWVMGFVLALITYFEDRHMAIVPAGTKAVPDRVVENDEGVQETRHVLILPKNQKLLTHKDLAGDQEIDQPSIFISHKKSMGTLFVGLLLLIIILTNVPMRGLWSVFVIMVLVMLSIIFAVAGWWEIILSRARLLAIHINLSGYLFLSLGLFIAWAVNFYLFDRQTYIIFTPGQVRVRLEIGGGETVFDTVGMVVHKQRGDLFRHWILGFGSGDLIVRPVGLPAIEMPNVLNVGWVVKQIEEMVRDRVVVSGANR